MPTINKNKQISGGSLYSTDSDHILTTADQIYDEQKGCYVSEYDFSGNVKSVNNQLPDQNGNITLNDKIKTVNGFEPDSFGNIDATIAIYFSLNNNSIECLRNTERLSSQSQLANLYNELTDIGLNVRAQKYNIVFYPCSQLLDIYHLGDILILLFQKFTDLTYQKEQYIQVKLTPEGVLSYDYITKNDVRSISLSENTLIVNTNVGQEEIPLPIKDDLITFSLDFNTDELTWTGNLDDLIKKDTSNIFLNGVQVSSIRTLDSGYKNLEFKNVNSNNFINPIIISYTIVIQVNIHGQATVLYKFPNLFYLDLKEDFTWKIYSEEDLTTDITNVFIEYLQNTPLDQINISEKIFVSDHNTLQVDNYENNEIYLTLLGYNFKYRYIVLNTFTKTYQERETDYLELQSNKVVEITDENKNSEYLYPSVKALVNYIDSQNPLETALEAENLEQFLAAAKTISENTSSTQRYKLKIKGVIDFANPSNKDKVATIKWQRNNNYGVYNEAERCWNFEGIFMYTVIQGDSSNATLKTTYTENGAIDTVSLKLFNAVFENITIGGTPLTSPSTIYHNWSRPLFIGTNNVCFKFTNCNFTILGHNSVDNPNNCKLIKAIVDSNTHQGTNLFQFYHTNIIFTTCTWNSGRNVWDNNEHKMSGGNLINAEITLDFSEDNIDAYKRNDLTRSLQIISNIKQLRFSDSGDNIEKDLPEIGIPRFHINCYNNEKWSVISDAHALITSNKPANINYYATVNINDAFFTNPVYVKTGDDTFNSSYALTKYIQDLENRIKTLETRLNTN